MATDAFETMAGLRAHALLLEMLLAYEIRQAAHVAMADPEDTARRLAEGLAKALRAMDEPTLAGPGAPLSTADRAAMVAAVKREIDRIVGGTIARLAKPTTSTAA